MRAITDADQVSETERRQLAERPVFEGDLRAYTGAFDDYLEDNFGLRLELIRIARSVRDNLGEDPPNVVVGKDGFLFLGSLDYRDEFEGNGQWDQTNVETWVDTLEAVNAHLSEHNIPFAAFIAVDKARAYPEKLPQDWVENPRRFRSAVHRAAEGRTTGLIDAEPIILDAKQSGIKVFYHRDTHWTAAGTYTLAMTLMDALDPERRRTRFVPGALQVETSTRLLDLEAMSGFQTTQEPEGLNITFPPFGPGGLQPIEPDGVDSPHQGQFVTMRADGTNTDPGGRLVIVGDSFADSMLPHFLPSYDEIIRIHHGAHLFDVSLDEILAYDPSAVLYATAERQAFTSDYPLRVMSD